MCHCEAAGPKVSLSSTWRLCFVMRINHIITLLGNWKKKHLQLDLINNKYLNRCIIYQIEPFPSSKLMLWWWRLLNFFSQYHIYIIYNIYSLVCGLSTLFLRIQGFG